MRHIRLIARVARDWTILAVLTAVATVVVVPLAAFALALVVLDEALARHRHE